MTNPPNDPVFDEIASREAHYSWAKGMAKLNISRQVADHEIRSLGRVPWDASARWQFEQDAKTIADWKWEYENVCKFATQYEDERDKLSAELKIAKEQLAWNLQNNDEFGCEFLGITILRNQNKELAAENKELKAKLMTRDDQ